MNHIRADSPLVNALAASPNWNERRAGQADAMGRPDMLIFHYTGLNPDASHEWLQDPGGQALAWLCNPAAEVSSHYLIETDGRIIQLVAEIGRAWHAGKSCWKGKMDLNSASIGIEIVNLGHDYGLPPYPDRQIAAVIALCREIIERWNIAPERVLAHSDIAPGRKADPGEHFPWNQLFKAGIGHWVEPAPLTEPGETLQPGDRGEPVRALRQGLADYGYGIAVSEHYDTVAEQTVQAFQRHFRPQKCDGIADASTRATLRELSDSLAKNNVV